MKLKITLDKKYYKSDSINNGRIIASFFEDLTKNVFYQSYKYYKEHLSITGYGQLPILETEKKLYSTVAAAIDKITPIHLSEWPFNPSDENTDSPRIVDLWCLHKEGSSGRAINYFIELKKSEYCLNKNTQKEFRKDVAKDIKSSIKQIDSIRKINPEWDGDDNAFIGMPIIHGYYRKSKEDYTYKDVVENIYEIIDKRLKAQLLTSTWHIPPSMDDHWEKDKCKFITIAGIVLTL